MLWITQLNNIGQRPNIFMLKQFINYIFIDCHTDPTKPLCIYGIKWVTQFWKYQKVIFKTEVFKKVKK